MVDEIITEAENQMKKSIEALKLQMQNIRTGRAAPGLIEKLQVEYYGVNTPLQQLASITAQEARLLVVQPFDKGAFGAIEKAIQKSELGLNPSNDGKVIRVPFPPLTEDRRKDLVKVAKNKIEEGKVSIRNIRRAHNDDLKEMLKEKMIGEDDEKRGQDKIEQLTTRYIHEVEEIGHHKEKEILEV
ncbi:ribosome recycling factor [Candidatus Chlorohelix sp.]|uniref:ribosome recycling factor n=1 Tax=Candidatus Chlorohelix sp. TaxID=3139201 RepID=UPI0030649B0D